MTYAEALRYRQALDVVTSGLNDEEADANAPLFRPWKPDTPYEIGDKRTDEGVLYKCLQAHTSQSDWAPHRTPGLWARVLNPDPGVIPVWEQPSAENAYMTGDKVHYKTIDDPVYESLIDNNVWSPEAYPQGWRQLLTGETAEETTEE